MRTETLYCPRCQRPVHLGWTDGPSHEGHASLPDGPELVCLEAGDGCAEGTCPHSNLQGLVMEVRLARSGLAQTPAPAARARCAACDTEVEMRVLDAAHLLCPVCGTTNRSVLPELLDHGQPLPGDT